MSEKLNPFEYAKRINRKQDIPPDLPGYSQWMINRILSCDQSFIEFVNEINKYGKHVSDRMHVDFCFNGIPKNSRYVKYNAKKFKDTDDALLIMKYYGCNREQAMMYLELISKEEMKYIKECYREVHVQKTTIKKRSKKQ